ncbi:MAG: L,D-transpeptidase family protein [Pseudomonadota bacterium]
MSSPVLGRRPLVLGLSALGVTACTAPPRTQADHVMILKNERRLLLIKHRAVFEEYRVGLGFSPTGHKRHEGDGRTPEGQYWVDRKNPNSAFHLSVGLDYPNAMDIARARAMGVDPGGDIFIHGRPNGPYDPTDPDWTAGCIAVTNREMEDIYASVRIGTPVTITNSA